MKVFLSYAVGSLDAAIPARLRAVAAAYDIEILLPDRTAIFTNELRGDTVLKIAQCDAVIALATNTAQYQDSTLLNLEVQTAEQLRKAIVMLVEIGMPFQATPNTPVVFFNRTDPTSHEASLLNVLTRLRSEQEKKDLTALGWIAGITLGLVALGAILGDKK